MVQFGMAQLARPRDELLALSLSAGATVKEAAQAAGMTMRNARTRKQVVSVRRRVAELVAETSARSVMLAAFATLPPDVRAEVARLLSYDTGRLTG